MHSGTSRTQLRDVMKARPLRTGQSQVIRHGTTLCAYHGQSAQACQDYQRKFHDEAQAGAQRRNRQRQHGFEGGDQYQHNSAADTCSSNADRSPFDVRGVTKETGLGVS